MEQECQERRAHRIERLLHSPRLPLDKTLDSFDLTRLPAKAARQVKTLADGTFLDRRENVLAFGNPGSGKTHLLSALGQELIRQGRRVSFTTCQRLVQELLRAKQELELNQAIKDPMTTAAAIDRLVHHSVIVELNVASYRVEQAKKKKADE